MFERILVPLDGSGFAESALPVAVAVTRGSGGVGSLEIVSAHDPAPPAMAGAEEAAVMMAPVHTDTLGAVPVTAAAIRESLREARTTYLHDVAGRLRDEASLDPGVALLEGRADRAILERVEERGVDLVVMATHGRGPIERAWLGSVADRLVRELAVPVLLVRPTVAKPADLTVSPAVQRVLVALDGSTLAEAALGPATLLAEALSVPVALIRAISVAGEIGSAYLPHAAQEHRDHLERSREEATAYVRKVSGELSARGVSVAGAEVVEGPAARTILNAADPGGDDVIAMATHGRGGLRRLVLGSVSDKVVRAATGPVLLVRPAEADE